MLPEMLTTEPLLLRVRRRENGCFQKFHVLRGGERCEWQMLGSVYWKK